MPLHVFGGSGDMFVIATDAKDAASVAAHIFDETDILGEEWDQIDDEEELTVRNAVSSEDDPVTRKAKDWAVQGRGYLASTEGGTWWLRGRHWMD